MILVIFLWSGVVAKFQYRSRNGYEWLLARQEWWVPTVDTGNPLSQNVQRIYVSFDAAGLRGEDSMPPTGTSKEEYTPEKPRGFVNATLRVLS